MSALCSRCLTLESGNSPVIERWNAIRSRLVGDEPAQARELGISNKRLGHVVIGRERGQGIQRECLVERFLRLMEDLLAGRSKESEAKVKTLTRSV